MLYKGLNRLPVVAGHNVAVIFVFAGICAYTAIERVFAGSFGGVHFAPHSGGQNGVFPYRKLRVLTSVPENGWVISRYRYFISPTPGDQNITPERERNYAYARRSMDLSGNVVCGDVKHQNH